MSTFAANFASNGAGIVPQSATDGAVDTANGSWAIPANCRALVFVCSTGAGGTSATYQVQTGDDVDGSTPVDASGYTVAHGATAAVSLIEVPVSELPAGKYVGIKSTVVGTAVVAATCHLLDASHPA